MPRETPLWEAHLEELNDLNCDTNLVRQGINEELEIAGRAIRNRVGLFAGKYRDQLPSTIFVTTNVNRPEYLRSLGVDINASFRQYIEYDVATNDLHLVTTVYQPHPNGLASVEKHPRPLPDSEWITYGGPVVDAVFEKIVITLTEPNSRPQNLP